MPAKVFCRKKDGIMNASSFLNLIQYYSIAPTMSCDHEKYAVYGIRGKELTIIIIYITYREL